MRRRFTRGGARPLRRMLMRGIPLLLIRSNELLTSGQFARTADGLEELARAAEGRQGRNAGDLYLRTGRARIMAGQSAEGLELLKRGVGLLSASPFHHRRARSARRIINELRDRGREQEAGGSPPSWTALRRIRNRSPKPQLRSADRHSPHGVRRAALQ